MMTLPENRVELPCGTRAVLPDMCPPNPCRLQRGKLLALWLTRVLSFDATYLSPFGWIEAGIKAFQLADYHLVC